LAAPRISRDVDLFHDTESALDSSWQADRRLLEQAGLSVRPLRERPWFIQAAVEQNGEAVLLQWVRDSASRFFPLVEHPQLGLVLHPFDLATTKVLAFVGRLRRRQSPNRLSAYSCWSSTPPRHFAATRKRLR
jgi:hypothetical protein